MSYPAGPGYGQPPYGPPAYPGYGPPPGRQNGLGTAALVLGILALLTSIFVIGGLLGLLGLVLGIAGIVRANRGRASNRGVAIAGVILSALAIAVATAVLAFAGWIFSTAGECLDTTRYPTPEAQQACFTEKFASGNATH